MKEGFLLGKFDNTKPVSIDNLPDCCGDPLKYRHTCPCDDGVRLVCVMIAMEELKAKEKENGKK